MRVTFEEKVLDGRKKIKHHSGKMQAPEGNKNK